MGDIIPSRYSYGIICVRRIGERPRYQILMVKKRFTYAFVMFINGAYRKDDYKRLGDLINKMTVEEKCLILLKDFTLIAKQLWMPANRGFLQLAKQFDETINARGSRFIKMIKACKSHGHLRWEVPKGKKNDHFETDIQAAVREFTEETGMNKDLFVLLPNITRVDSYVDERVRYITKYFVGYGTYEPTINHFIDNEIADVRWMDLSELAITDALGNAHMRQIVKPAVNAIKKALKNGII